jgi:hypothetical protein
MQLGACNCPTAGVLLLLLLLLLLSGRMLFRMAIKSTEMGVYDWVEDGHTLTLEVSISCTQQQAYFGTHFLGADLWHTLVCKACV